MTTETRAFLFDVFGTCVDWRTTVTNALIEACNDSLSNSDAPIDKTVRQKASTMRPEDWGAFAQAWRSTYHVYTRSVAADPSQTWKTIDEHNLDSLRALLTDHGLLLPAGSDAGGLWTPDEIKRVSLIWHFLDPWPDTVRGLEMLNTRFDTCTLSNGNIALLTDMKQHARMPFTQLFSSEMFHSYKPNPVVYLGAARRLGLEPAQCVLVAAHLGDLEAAKKCGYGTVYVERPLEESKDMEVSARERGFVDYWVGDDEHGFVTVAEKMGI